MNILEWARRRLPWVESIAPMASILAAAMFPYRKNMDIPTPPNTDRSRRRHPREAPVLDQRWRLSLPFRMDPIHSLPWEVLEPTDTVP
jgi:hypothetical protein